jgi:putative ABC transport system permease protein
MMKSLYSESIWALRNGISAIDPATFASVAAIVLAASVLATWQPVRHASHVDPVVALRHE